MKAKRPSKRLITELAQRLLDLGVTIEPDDPEALDMIYGKVACGDALLAVKRGPDRCDCCNKPVIHLTTRPVTPVPLESLIPDQ